MDPFNFCKISFQKAELGLMLENQYFLMFNFK